MLDRLSLPFYLQSQSHPCFDTPPTTTARGTDTVQSVQKGKEMTRDQAEMIENLFSKLAWTTYQWKAKDEKLLTDEDRLPDGVKKMVHQGLSTYTKPSGEGMKLLKKLGEHSDEFKPLKKAYTECQKHISDLKHIQDFKELPDDKKLTQDSFDKYMAQVLSQQIICFSLIWHDDDALIFWFFK